MRKGNRLGWRLLVVGTLAGSVVAGAWFGFLQAGTQTPFSPEVWTTTATPPPAPDESLAPDPEANAPRLPISPLGPVVPAGATLPIPVPREEDRAVPPPKSMEPPVTIPIPPSSIPPSPRPAPPGDIQPTTGPQIPDIHPGPGTIPLPAIPIPPMPPAATIPPPLDVPPPPRPQSPSSPGAPLLPPSPQVPNISDVAPQVPSLPPMPKPSDGVPNPPLPDLPPVRETPPPAKPTEPRMPNPPVKSDSDLNPNSPGHTLNPSAPSVEPMSPKRPRPASGGETPAPPAPNSPTPAPDFPTPETPKLPPATMPQSHDPPTRDDTMRKLTTHAALAILGGALFAIEHAHAFPPVPPASTLPTPGLLVKADSEVEKLKNDLAEANKRIKSLEEQVAKLTELLNGKKDDRGFRVESDPGAVEEIKRLKDKITKLEDELRTLKTQTALRPSTPPDSKPMGIVKIINDYPIEVSIVINDKSYRVAPSKVLDVEVPAGEFTYQLLQSGAPATKSVIRDKETVRLRIK